MNLSMDVDVDGQDTWILGQYYSQKQNAQKKKYHRHVSSLVRLTYRKDFPPLAPYHYTDDSGWGCMLRSAQSMMAQTLLRHYLGDDWRLADDIGSRRSNAAYVEVLRWFADFPGLPYVYSIHNMIQCGMKYDKLPGEWYGPSTAAFVLRDLTKLHHRKHTGELEVYVTTGDTIYISDVNKLCTGPAPTKKSGPTGGTASDAGSSSVARATINVSALKTSLSAAVLHSELAAAAAPIPAAANVPAESSSPAPFFDPLLHVPPNSTTEKPWSCSLLVIVPLKLGVYNVSEAYREEVKKVLRHRNSVGILGGRPNHAIYFVGYSVPAAASGTTQLVGLDPHTTYSTNHYTTEPFPSPELCAQVHPAVIPSFSTFDDNAEATGASGSAPCSASTSAYESMCCSPTHMPIEQLDPSIALGFYFRTKAEFEAFCAEKTNKPSNSAGLAAAAAGVPPASTPSILYNIEYAEPTYDFSMYDQEEEEECDGGGGDRPDDYGRNDDDKDDEYVFI